MPCSCCSALHGVNPNENKTKQKKTSYSCKKTRNSMRKTISTLLSSNSITCRNQHPLSVKRAETTHGKPNLMQLKVGKCVKMLLLPLTERAVKVWEKSNSLPTKEAMRANGKKHNHSFLNKQRKHQEHHHYRNCDSIWIDIPTISFKRNDNICKITSTNF